MTSTESSQPRHSVVPYLLVERVDDLIAYCRDAFEARLLGRLTRPDGSLMHAEVAIGDSLVMMGEPMGELGPAPAMLFVTVDDCEAVYERALAAGGESVMEVTHMHPAGERYGGVRDAHGNVWWISTTVEEVPWDEQQRRIQALVDQELGR